MDAVTVVRKHRRASVSLVQRHLRIGYNRAARLLESMETAGLVSAMTPSGSRRARRGPGPAHAGHPDRRPERRRQVQYCRGRAPGAAGHARARGPEEGVRRLSQRRSEAGRRHVGPGRRLRRSKPAQRGAIRRRPGAPVARTAVCPGAGALRRGQAG
ncbi:hypothetical protein G6F65_020652 [Rhizopus arrhizus]|nr:hypothetical protein G6F65_020652 [Rhizopus arrhizus]